MSEDTEELIDYIEGDTVQLLAYIKDQRQKIAAYYPLANGRDCVRRAIFRLGRYEDAILRQESAVNDARAYYANNDARLELGGVGELLGAAITQAENWQRADYRSPPTRGVMGEPRVTRLHLVGLLLNNISVLLRQEDKHEKCGGAFVFSNAWTFGVWLGLVQWHCWKAHFARRRKPGRWWESRWRRRCGR